MSSDGGPDAEVVWVPAFRTDVGLTLGRAQRGRRDPTQQTAPDGSVWRTVRAIDGPATVRFDEVEGRLRCRGWGPGATSAVAAAEWMLGGADDPSGFVPRHPFLVAAHRRFAGLRIAGSGDVLHALVAAVLEQRVEGVEALAAWATLVTRLGGVAPGPAPTGMRVFPDGRVWLAVSSWEWRRAGVDARRAETIRRAAAVDGSLQRLLSKDPAGTDRALRSVEGVGGWTAAEVRQRAFGDRDALSLGDFHLAKIVGQTLAGRPFTDAELLPFMEEWRPHRYRVARLVYASGIESLPRHAPRRPRPPQAG